MARVRRGDGTFTNKRDDLPEKMNTRVKHPRVTYDSVRHLRDLGRLIHKEYPHIRVTEGVFIAKVIFMAIEQSLMQQCRTKRKRRAIHIPGFGTFYARSIPPQEVKNKRAGYIYDVPARYRLSWKAVPSWRKRLAELEVLPDESGEFGYSAKTKPRRKKKTNG